MTLPLAVDTSVAIALLVQTHREHALVTAWWRGQPVALSGHALAETYSVLTRLPGDIRLSPPDAVRLLAERFEPPLLLKPATASRLPSILAKLGVAGGATFDALVALAAAENGYRLATRDARASNTYTAVGVEVEIVA